MGLLLQGDTVITRGGHVECDSIKHIYTYMCIYTIYILKVTKLMVVPVVNERWQSLDCDNVPFGCQGTK
jgi:hypothetical protein